MLAPFISIPAVERLTATRRLSLRPPAAADARSFRDLLTDPANRRFDTGGPAASERLELWRALWTRDGLGPWAVALRDQPALGAIGFGGLSRGRICGAPALLLEFHFLSDHWGQGYAAEMATAALALAFDSLHATSVHALLAPGNTAARKTLERVGLRLTGSVADCPGEAASLLYEINAGQYAALPQQPPEATPFGA
ncbi:GNAT family N-acetyltransferase [Roseateles chitinivorans]|uniref:GNAT family N-acetyltransferase n=1 Tax=Roseateles chitinivorans TaxID=2917965 RepID=UPI003D67FCD6